MTKKGFEFRFATKGNLQGPQRGLFIQTSPNSTHSSPAPITAQKLKRKQLIAIADHTKLELSAWLKLVKLTPEKIIADLISTIQDAIEGCQRAALYKTKAVIIEKLRSHPVDRPRHARHQEYHLHLVHLVALRKKL